MNAGWDHQRALDCGGYNCLQRLMTFHTTVALVGRCREMQGDAGRCREM